jgi:hypothetical protein
MKKMYLLLPLMLLMLAACGPSKEEAIAYNDKIIDQQVLLIDKINSLEKSMEVWDDHAGMDRAYIAAIKQLEESTEVVSKLEKFDGSTEFRDGALKLFGIYKSVLDNEYKEMVALYKLSDEQFTTKVEDKWNSIHDAAMKKMDDGLNELRAVQTAFSEKYEFQIDAGK